MTAVHDHASAAIIRLLLLLLLLGGLFELTRGMGQPQRQQESGGISEEDNTQRRGEEEGESDPDEGEAGGGHFRKGPWLSMCSAVDAPIAEEVASDTKGECDRRGHM